MGSEMCIRDRSKEAAEQIVNDEWYIGKHILIADDFTGVEFEVNTI